MESKFNINRFIKKEGTPSGSRLQSLRMPRDLSLGGTKIKKVYAPNLNVTRNKDKSKEIKTSDRKRKDRPTPNGTRTRQNQNTRFVQSSGVFSEGAGDAVRVARAESRFSNRSEPAESASMPVPTLRRDDWNVNKKAENNVIDELVNYNEESDDEKMSMQPLAWKKIDKKVKEEVKSISTPFFSDQNYDDDNLGLSVIKLPDSFAGKGLSDDPNVKQIFDYPLSSMLEGRIGSLQIRKSGKIQVKLGRITYDLEPTDFFNGHEEVAELSSANSTTESHDNTSGIAIFGKVNQRFIINPIWSELLKST